MKALQKIFQSLNGIRYNPSSSIVALRGYSAKDGRVLSVKLNLKQIVDEYGQEETVKNFLSVASKEQSTSNYFFGVVFQGGSSFTALAALKVVKELVGYEISEEVRKLINTKEEEVERLVSKNIQLSDYADTNEFDAWTRSA
jgi:hypothetical protein